MGCRRYRGSDEGLFEVAHRPAQSVSERRSGYVTRSGVLLLLLGVACGPAQPQPAADMDDLVVAFPEGNVQGSDLGVDQFANWLLVDGLTSANEDGRAVPRLAENWQWENDGLRLRLRLRPNVFFHDGTHLTGPVVADILRAAASDSASHGSYSSLADVTAITAEGDLQVVVDLSRRSAFLPEDLTMALQVGPKVGTGPYRLVERGPSAMRFERFDRYYLGTPAIERIEVRTVDTLRTAWTSLLRGDVDMVSDVPAEALEFVRNNDVDVITYKRSYQFMIAFNSTRRPFSSPAVRRALNVAVDRPSLIQGALKDRATPATGPLWPGHWAYDASTPSYGFEPDLAKELLDNAGFPLGATRSGGPPRRRLTFTCLIPADFSILERIGLEVQKQLYDVGVDLQFDVVPLKEYNQRILAGQFQAVLVDMISGPTLARLYIFWRSAKQFSGLNVFGYENAEAERQFQILRSSPLNDAAVRSGVSRLQRVFHDDPPALFLAWNERTRAVRSEFQVIQELDRDPMLTLWRWAASERRVSLAR
jgi:peptide/nickel transport system substrate-binding protein